MSCMDQRNIPRQHTNTKYKNKHITTRYQHNAEEKKKMTSEGQSKKEYRHKHTETLYIEQTIKIAKAHKGLFL